MEYIEHDGKEFIFVKKVKLHGGSYNEYMCANPMTPEIIYAEESTGQIITDFEMYINLREKYAADKKAIWGKFVLNARKCLPDKGFENELRSIPFFKDVEIEYTDAPTYITQYDSKTGEQFEKSVMAHACFIKNTTQLLSVVVEGCRIYNKFFLEKGTEFINELFDADVEKFSTNLAQQFGHLYNRYGIDDPKTWLEEKFRGTTKYEYAPDLLDVSASCYTSEGGLIRFSSIADSLNEKIRAHEMAHKVSTVMNEDDFARTGIFIVGEKKWVNQETGENFVVYSDQGVRLNEGITNMVSAVLTEQNPFGNCDSSYPEETSLAKDIATSVGIDTIMEGYFLNPTALINSINKLMDDKNGYMKLITAIDECQRLNDELNTQYKLTPDEIASAEWSYNYRCKQIKNITEHIKNASEINGTREVI